MSNWELVTRVLDNLRRRTAGLERRMQFLEANAETGKTGPTNTYGEIYCQGATGSLVLTMQNRWYQVTNFDTNGEANGTTPDHTSDDVTIDAGGVYLVTVPTSFSGSASSTFELQVHKNNGASGFNNLYCTRALGTSGDVGSTSIGGLVSLSDGDTVELWVRCTSGAGKSITVRDCTLSVVRVA